MAKAHRYFIGAGCLLIVFGAVILALLVKGLSAPSLPRQMVLSVRLAGPIAEVTAEDPLAELMGDQATGLRNLREALVLAADDDRVKGVRLRVDNFGGGIATAQELRGLIVRAGAAGKWTAAYIETAGEFAPGNFVYYVVSACDEVVLHPQGDVNLVGISIRSPFIRGTLDKLGIRPEFPGRGDYKTARFLFTQRDFTPAHKEMMEWLAESIMDQMTQDIGDGRGLDVDEVQNLIDRAPFLGEEAVDVGLVDRLESWGDFTTRVADENEGAETVSVRSYLRRRSALKKGPKIAVVTAVGTIMRGASGESYDPLVGGAVMGSDTISKAFRDVRRTSGVKAVIFRIDSPGGSAIASEIIRQEMEKTAETVPVVVSMSNMAGSGGYWISCGAHRIVADPSTITGSIGVLGGHLNTSAFWSGKLGVTFGRLDMGVNANIYGDLEDWTDGQRAVVDRMLDRIYDDFVGLVADSRGMTTDEVDAIGRGRVFTGVQGWENGLVDVVGGFDEALVEAKKLADIAPDADVQLVDFPRPLPWWRRFSRARTDEIAVVKRLEIMERWIETGTVTIPGVVWMPPITIE